MVLAIAGQLNSEHSGALQVIFEGFQMSIDTWQITADQANKILALRESQFTDLKAKEIAPNKLAKHFSALANVEAADGNRQ
jgi:hypothetical protein